MILRFCATAHVSAAARLLTFILHRCSGRRLLIQRSESRRFFRSRSLFFIDDWSRDCLLITDFDEYLNFLRVKYLLAWGERKTPGIEYL